jgi:hypothetical protein
MQLIKRELFGGPFDGEWVIVPPDQITVLRIDGHSLHRYDFDEIHEGPKTRVIYRHSVQVPASDAILKALRLDPET